MREKYRQATAALLVVDTYETENASLPEKKQRWVDEQRYQAQKKQRANGWMNQQKLVIQMALLHHEARLWQEAMKPLT